MSGFSFTAIDFETANGKRESVCAVGLAKVRDGIVVDRWYSLVRPPAGHDHFHPMNIAVHGIRAPRGYPPLPRLGVGAR